MIIEKSGVLALAGVFAIALVIVIVLFLTNGDDIQNTTFITAGGQTWVIDNNGDLWGWGQNAHAQLGDGSRVHRQIPVRIMGGVRSIQPFFAITEDNTLYAWMGGNNLLQLQHNIDRASPQPIMNDIAE